MFARRQGNDDGARVGRRERRPVERDRTAPSARRDLDRPPSAPRSNAPAQLDTPRRSRRFERLPGAPLPVDLDLGDLSPANPLPRLELPIGGPPLCRALASSPNGSPSDEKRRG